MDRLASMAAFVKTADLGSFAATASALGISPQMVAKHVTYLEDRLGVRLINRTTRRQSLTETGRTYYERCRTVLAEVDWADALGNETRAEPRGRLRVSAPVSFGSATLPLLVTRFLRSHPEVDIDLVLTDRMVELVDEGFEAAFRIGHMADSALVARELRPFRLVVCASPDYLRENGIPAAPPLLKMHECLGYSRGPTLDKWLFVQDSRVYDAAVSGRLRVNDAKALLAAALDGFGIAMIAEELARDFLTSGRLVRIMPDYEVPTRPMHLVYLGDGRQTPKLRCFIDAAVEAFGPQSWRGASG